MRKKVDCEMKECMDEVRKMLKPSNSVSIKDLKERMLSKFELSEKEFCMVLNELQEKDEIKFRLTPGPKNERDIAYPMVGEVLRKKF